MIKREGLFRGTSKCLGEVAATLNGFEPQHFFFPNTTEHCCHVALMVLNEESSDFLQDQAAASFSSLIHIHLCYIHRNR